MTGSPPALTALATASSGSGRRAAPETVWAAVRADYLAGVSGPECCRRHGVGLSALRERAARGGWRRADQVWTPPNRLDPEDEGMALEQEVDGDLDRIEPIELAFVANRRMMRAALRGDAAEALRWRRVQLVMREEEAETLRFIAEDALIMARRAPADPDASDGPDGPDSSDASDGVFPVRTDRPA